ncbi:MAG: serine hydrolase [Thermoleophilia bacterium]|nr:serine hydrolase [Thermoleophilia bacterium]
MRGVTTVLAVAVLASLDGDGTRAARAADPLLARAIAVFAAAERADAVGAATASTAQRQYDAARDLEVALPDMRYVSRACRPLARDLRAYARGLVREAEGFDRLNARLARAGARRAADALDRLERHGLRCPTGRPPRGPGLVHELTRPRRGEAFFGTVADARVCADEVVLFANGRRVGRIAAPPADFSFVLKARPGVYDLGVRQLRGGRVCWRTVSQDVYLLPRWAERGRPPWATDPGLVRRLAAVGEPYSGYAGLYVHDLARGRAAGWNADARFPAASTVKLGLLVATLQRFSPHSHGAALSYELETMAAWSSNLAANRLLRKLGDGSDTLGSRRVEATLRRMGARSSTYPGGYRVGTSASDVQRQPPLVSARVTTARDLGRVMWLIHAAALGRSDGRRATGLAPGRARFALGALLRWERGGANGGLVAPSLPRGMPIAQKSGWLSAVRHTAALVYARTGPKIVVVLAYEPEIADATARALGARVAAAARLR